MKNKYKRVPTRFAPESRFEVTPVPAVPLRGAPETELDRLKLRLLQPLLNETPEPELNARIRRAANEAAAVAWMTSFPLLLFPTLLIEKTQEARRQSAKQRWVRRRSRCRTLRSPPIWRER